MLDTQSYSLQNKKKIKEGIDVIPPPLLGLHVLDMSLPLNRIKQFSM